MQTSHNHAANDKRTLFGLRKKIQLTQFILIVVTTLLMSIGGLVINIGFNDKAASKEQQNMSSLITRLFFFTKDFSHQELCSYMDSIVQELPEIDVISIVDKDRIRLYHTNHSLIGTEYDGTIPDFKSHANGHYTENDKGPSGPQRRTYSAIYDEGGNYSGFIMAIRLRTSIRNATIRAVGLFFAVTVVSMLVAFLLRAYISKNIKREFLEFTEDFEGTKFLVDSMRANNHDFTNKLHVILGLIQMEEYEKAKSYIENISIIQKETISHIMSSIENPSFAALLVGKIARASECNVRFILQEGICFKDSDIDVPSEALVTITGNLIDNALDAMNSPNFSEEKSNELTFGAFTKPGELLITVKDTGSGIPDDIQKKIFERGFSTKGSGRGVGLSHTRQLVESLGGKISVESQVGKGACFMVVLKR